MSRLTVIAGVCVLIIGLGVGLYAVFSPAPKEVVTAPTFDREVKDMIRFVNPAITEEIANKYLAELQKLNESYGYKPGGTPKGDIETMQAYGREIETLQKKYNINPSPETASTSGMKSPSLAPKAADTTYMPPSKMPETVASSNVQSKTTPAPSGPPAADPDSSASLGGPASSPPLIKQDNIPPAPPVPTDARTD